jgi:hypothetical protein
LQGLGNGMLYVEENEVEGTEGEARQSKDRAEVEEEEKEEELYIYIYIYIRPIYGNFEELQEGEAERKESCE